MSEGDRCHVAKWEDYVDDMLMFCVRVAEEYPKIPMFILGHSMGGMIAALCALKKPKVFSGGVILSGPFLGPHPSQKPDVNSPFIR